MTVEDVHSWDCSVDLLVAGAGAAGMTAALVGSIEGLETVICEKSDKVGGITSTSAGTIWVPGTAESERAGVPDSIEAAETYLASVIGTTDGNAERQAFLASGRQVLDYLEEHTDVRFAAGKAHPDYLSNHPGAAFGGRALGALSFDGRVLKENFEHVQPPRSEFTVLSGMMVAKADIRFLLKPFGSVVAFLHVARMLLRHGWDRIFHSRGTALVMGNALVGRLLHSLTGRGVPIWFDTYLVDLIEEKGVVVGAVVDGKDGRRLVRARRGVVLATGGVGWNQGLREKLFPKAALELSLAPESHTGDGIELGMKVGADLDDELESRGLWMPCSIFERPDGKTSIFPHIVLDRAKPGLLAINQAGRRFVNEADSYHDFVLGMLRADSDVPSVPAFLICDQSFIEDYGIGLIHPGIRKLEPFRKAGYLVQADTLTELADKIGVDGQGLERTIADYNRYAETGIDDDFGRGSSDLNRINGDSDNEPNPCLRRVGPGPFFAVAVWPADLASSAGLRTDADARVLNIDRLPIPGLYACGNDATSIFRGAYPGPGATLGPALVFAWRAARAAAGATLEDSRSC